MPRFALLIDYDGTPFNGWQRQAAGQPSVQAAIEAALARLEPGEHTIAAAGRTDAGVHATGQVAHCDLARDWDPFRLSEALNHHLKPAPVAILACARVEDDFHGLRRSAEDFVIEIVAGHAEFLGWALGFAAARLNPTCDSVQACWLRLSAAKPNASQRILA